MIRRPLLFACLLMAMPHVCGAQGRGSVAITPILHSSVQIEFGGQVVQVDPGAGATSRARSLPI